MVVQLRAVASLTLLLFAATAHAEPPPSSPSGPRLQFDRERLANGLTLLMAPEPGNPLVHVELWYRGGAAADPPERPGLAHLLAHVVDRGTRHVGDRAYARELLAAGATALAADPMFDYTRFAVTAPAGALDRVLWLESSRMGFAFERSDPGSVTRLDTGLFPALTSIIADERGAMAQERAQRPMAEQLVAAARTALHGPLSPYGRDPVGDERLSTLGRPELRRYYDRAYHPRQAVLVITGGVQPARIRQAVRRLFGPLASVGAPPVPAPFAAAPPAAARRVDLEGAAGSPRVLLSWPSAAAYADGEAELEVAAELLGGGPRSPLGRALEGLARRATVRQVGLAGAGQFEISIELTRAAAATEAVNRVQALLGDLRGGRIDVEAVAGARQRLHTRRLAELETLAGRAQRLARYQVLAGDAEFLRRDLERLAAVDAGRIQAVVTDRLRDDQRVLVTAGVSNAAAAPPAAGPAAPAKPPAPRPAAAPLRVTRDDARWRQPPPLGPLPRPPAAKLRPTKLRNGLTLWVLPASGASTARLELVIAAGSADDPPEAPGVARQLARALFAPASPAAGKGPLAALARLGASTETAVDSDHTRFSLLVARRQLDQALPLWLAALAGPPQPAAGASAPGASQPERALARLMFGEAHPYVRALEPGASPPSPAALRGFFEQHYHPGNATVIATGPVTGAELGQRLGRWPASPRGAKGRATKHGRAKPGRGGKPARAATAKGATERAARPRIVLIDRPGTRITELRLGHRAVSRSSPEHAAVLVANELLGGRFGRLDRLLRLERPLALGLRTSADARRHDGLWVVEASFPSDQATVGLQEILRTLDALAGGEAGVHEVARVRATLLRRLAARVGPRLDRAAALADLAAVGQDERALGALAKGVGAVDAGAVRRVFRTYLNPERLSLVVVGDRRALEEMLRDLGEVEVRPEAPAPTPGPATAARSPGPRGSALR